MAKYEIHHCCGHVRTVNLYGKTADRNRTIEWLESQPCPDCKREEENEANAKKAAAENRPVLTGSEKQVAWANTIRENTISTITADRCTAAERKLRSVLDLVTTGVHQTDPIDAVLESIERRLRKQLKEQEAIMAAAKDIAAHLGSDKDAKIVAMLLDAANEVTDARTWIDNRDCMIEYLANVVAVKLIGSDIDKAPVVLQPNQYGRCKNGSYYVRTRGYEINTDCKVNTELAFVDAELVTDNEDGTISIAKDDLQHALDLAAWKTAQRIGVSELNVEIHVVKADK